MNLTRAVVGVVLGRVLANREAAGRKIGTVEAVPAMGLDAVASSAYGPEAALTILAPLGAAGLVQLGWITVPILVLLGVLYASYRQIVRAYPSNGGAYTVSKENLGARTSLLAATALMIDYVLNVAVGISAGVGALTSALPALHPYTLALCLAILAVVTLANLRGTPEAGWLFALPTYLFIASFGVVLALGVAKTLAAGGHPAPLVPPPALPAATGAVTAWLLVRAFASGCTAMTGVEAVSNGVDAFREPVVAHGHRTLSAICGVLGLLLAGIAVTVIAYRVGAMDQTRAGYQSVLSQLTGAVVGRGPFYFVAIGSLLCVLALSANTSFVGFPRLCRLVAEDDYLPRPFAVVGRRLVFSVGILYLAASAGVLLVVFDGITDRLIPLFAVGAFLAFTLSQTGMVVHWRRALRGRGAARLDRVRLVINGVGAATTGAALIVIVIAKFAEGAWITVLVVPCVILLLTRVKRYYARLEARLAGGGALALGAIEAPIVLVTAEAWNRAVRRAVTFALRLSREVWVVHCSNADGPDVPEKRSLRRDWRENVERPAKAAGLPPPRLVLLPAPYRRLQGPLLKLIQATERRHPSRVIAVLIPEVIKRNWWEHLLHTRRAASLRRALLRYGGSRTVVIDFPWYLEEPKRDEALDDQAPDAAPRSSKRSTA
ncbi:MAG TPA: APC family permease [Candidatus Sulfotelmatobacter sp.]|nr:APC family permease [Candidatus Sulfotelmatobacter sp.]